MVFELDDEANGGKGSIFKEVAIPFLRYLSVSNSL